MNKEGAAGSVPAETAAKKIESGTLSAAPAAEMGVPGLSSRRGDGPELVIGLIGAVGTDLAQVRTAVGEALGAVSYGVETIRLSELLHQLPGGEELAKLENEDERIDRHMDAGNKLRRDLGRGDALAGLAVAYIASLRKERSPQGESLERVAFVLSSLKNPSEVRALRNVYGPRFVLVSAHAPRARRREKLMRDIARSRGAMHRADQFQERSEGLMERDEREEADVLGQNVRDSFTLADVFVEAEPREELDKYLRRFVQLFFGDPFQTPTKAEYAMFQAQAAALRSADLSRQVGAVVATPEGDIVAVGTNEVPKAFGGQYWADDGSDERDFKRGFDSNETTKREALEEAFDRLASDGTIEGVGTLDDFVGAVQGTRLASITEFGRPVHAEMAALLDAARRGVSVAGNVLFTTTFPCHNCAKHIVAAGIRKVIYREPYAKSLAAKLHPDAIVVDPALPEPERVGFQPFVGLAPPRYFDLFTKLKREEPDGQAVRWDPAASVPRLVVDDPAYRLTERFFLRGLSDDLEKVDGMPIHLIPEEAR